MADMDGYVRDHAEGEVAELGVASMRLVVSKADTDGTFALAEFHGSEGRWTVPHVHHEMIESFYVLDGTFLFTVGTREIEVKQGAFVMVPRGTRHVMSAGPGGGTLLTLFSPGGLEDMFLELGRLPAGSITDPRARAEIATRHDSVPVS